MSFWQQASDQAGREVGARYWRLFAAARILKTIWPVLAVGVLIVLAVVGYRLAEPATSSVRRGHPVAIAVGVVIAIGLGIIALAVRKYLSGPPRRRRRFRG